MVESIIEKNQYTKQDIVSLLKLTDRDELDKLYDLANKVKEKHFSNLVQVRALLEFSIYCERNCLYCGKRRSNEKIERYRLEPDEIIEYAKKTRSLGFKSLILQSGEDFYYTVEILESIIKKIKLETDLGLTLNIGERTEDEYKRLKEAGADRFLLKHETSDPVLYRSIHPDLKYANRIKCLRTLKSIGFETGSGIIVGLPGQTFESIANDILLFEMLDIDMVAIDPYITHKNTPLVRRFEQMGGYFAPAIGYYDIEELIHKIMAITRIITKKAYIPVSGNLKDFGFIQNALKCGANVIVLNIADSKIIQNYATSSAPKGNNNKIIETPEELSACLREQDLVIR